MASKLDLTRLVSMLGLACAGALATSTSSATALDNDNCDRASGNICFEAIDAHEFWLNPGVSFTTRKGVLVAQADGNLVLKDETGRVRWSTNTGRNTGAAAVWQEDGNLVVYQENRPIWASNTGGIGAYLVLQTDGNLVIYDASDKPIWASNTGH